MVTISIKEYLTALGESRLIPGSRLRETLRALAEQTEPQSADEVGQYLIDQDMLTAWQHEQLTRHRRKQFYLGKYKLLRPLGSGGMAQVYLAEHARMQRQVALKFLSAEAANDPLLVARFHREAQAVASLDHPNIVHAYEVDSHADTHYLAMEYIDGPDLQTLIQRDGPAEFVSAADWIRQAALALDHVHQAEIVHRDIKPSNLMLTSTNVVKLTDMGVARVDDQNNLTENQVVGTADYLAPEQATDSHSVDARADLYSLGATLYFLLTGRPPFTGETVADVLVKHQQAEPASILDVRPDAPPELVEICQQLLAKQPDDRIPTAADLAQRLQTWIESQAPLKSTETMHGNTGDTMAGASPLPPAAVITEGIEESTEQLADAPFPVWISAVVAGGGLILVIGVAVAVLALRPSADVADVKEPVNMRSFVDPNVKWRPEGEDDKNKKARGRKSKGKSSSKDSDHKTEVVGGGGGGAFSTSDPQGRPVVGFHYTFGSHAGDDSIARITPVYDRDAELPKNSALAREGYVLVGMNVAHNHSVCAVQPFFVRANGLVLQPDDRYGGKWHGDRKEMTVTKLGDTGVPVLGFYGRSGGVIDAMGLLLAPATSQLYAYDHFNDGNQGAIAGQATGHGFSGPWRDEGHQDSDKVKTPEPRLGNRSLDKSEGLSLLLADGKQEGDDVSWGAATRDLEQSLGANDSTLYVSYHVKATGDIGDGPHEGYGGLALGNTEMRVFVGFPGGDDQTPWSVGKFGSREDKFTGRSEALLRKHRVVQLVLRADFQSGPDRLSLYVNPDPATEPEKPDAVMNALDVGQITRVGYAWSGSFRVDELRLGPTYQSVASPRPD